MIFVLLIIIVVILTAFLIITVVNKTYKNKIDKIYIINLEKRSDRLTFVESNYNLEKEFIIYKAIDGNSLDLKQLETEGIIDEETIRQMNKKREHHFELTHKGAIGCYLSHYYLWKSLKESDDNQILIIEDDIIFNKITLREINKRLLLLPTDWDIYLLIDENYAYDNNYYNKQTHKNLLKVNRFFGTHAYIINKKAVEKIFKTNTIFPINQQIDSYLSELSNDFNLNIYVHNNYYNNYNQSSLMGTDIQIHNNSQLSYKRNLLIKLEV